MKNLMWWLFAGMKGGINRAEIIRMLHDRPYNAHQLAEELNLDYKTVRHHIQVLEKNDLIISGEEKYGKMYFLSSVIEKNYDVFLDIWKKLGKK
ncbi:MAG: winged helix-turn-helix domain-containing protein [Methanobacterium sp.]